MIGIGLWAPHQASAQTPSSIDGTVTDASGGVVANAKVSVTNNANSVIKTTVTSKAGTYVVTGLIAGSYTVKVENKGFQTSVHRAVTVEVGRSATIDAALETGNMTETVEVQGDVIALNTTQPNLNTSVENAMVQALPLEISFGRGRQIDSFVFLAPGVGGNTFEKGFNGGLDFESAVVFNGVPMAQPELQGLQTVWNPPFELVNEFAALRSSFSAQYGLAQGVVTYQTASGTNQLHGDAFEIIRNSYFDSRGAYNAKVPIDNENNYGFTIAGPVIIPKLYDGKNKTFFHVSMEWYRQNQQQAGLFSLPTSAEKAGDFSALGTTIFNPVHSGCTANGNLPGTPFKGNIIPTACFSALSASLLQYIPNATLPGFVNNSQNLQGVFPTRQNPWGFTIDENVSDRQSVHFATWRDMESSYGGSNFLPPTNPLQNNSYSPLLGTVFLANYTLSITPNLVMTAGASWLGEVDSQIQQRTGATPDFPAAPGAPIVPGINFVGPLSPQGGYGFPYVYGSPTTNSVNRKLGWVVDNNYLWVKGRHTLNIGWELRRTYQDANQCQQCAGNFNFSNNTTADPYNPDNLGSTGNSFASFLLGLVDSSNRIGSQEERLRNWDVSSYIQDDIKVNNRLTLNLGVRWDIMVPFTAIGNTIVYFDSKIPNPGAGGLPGAATQFGNCFGCSGVYRANVRWTNFGPRTGFSYALNSKTILQGGFSMNYLNGGAYQYGTSQVASSYGNLLLGSFSRNSTGSPLPGFGSWDSNVAPIPAPTPFSPTIGNATRINAFDPATDGRAPYDLAWSFGVQRELPWNMFLTAAYTGNRANYLPGQLNPINQLSPAYLAKYGALLGRLITDPLAVAAGIKSPYPNFVSDFGPSATVLQALRPYPQFAGIFGNFDDTSSALYNAGQFQLQKRYTNGLSLLFSYTLSRLMANTSSSFVPFQSAALNKDNQKSEWSPAWTDSPNDLSLAATYELPFGRGKPFLGHANVLVNAFVGGWQISPLIVCWQGSPLQITVAGDPLGNGVANRPNIVTGQTIQYSYSNVYKGLPVLNAAAFSDPGQWAIGNEPRTMSGTRSPWWLNENIAAAKSFMLGERVRLRLQVQFFNALNRVVFCGPNTNLNDPNFGKVINCQANSNRQGQGQISINF
jgi:hypothetical protein